MKRQVKTGGRTVEYTLIATPNRTDVLSQALPNRKIRVYAPKSARLREMDALVIERLKWIDEVHQRQDELTKKQAFSEISSIPLEGRRVNVMIQKSVKNEIMLTGGTLIIKTRSEEDAQIEAQVKKWLCERALKRIREALDIYAPTIAKPYGRITIREQKTRWGSCSSKNNLNFNWKLILAPKEALTYVVIHEICHLVHFNHSDRFWALVKARMPDYEIWKKWLKDHGKELTLWG